MALTLTKTLRAFAQHDGGDTVSILVRTVVLDGTAVVATADAEIYGSNAALTTYALAHGKTAWDEDVICAVHGITRSTS